MASVIPILSQKGGVGKSMTVANLAPALARTGLRILAVDLDSQGPLARAFGAQVPEERILLAKALKAKDLSRSVFPTRYRNVFLVPGDFTADPDEFPTRIPLRDLLLRRALEPLRAEYDFILIDTKGSLDLLTTNAILAADWVILACEPDYESVLSAQGTISWIHGLYPDLETEISKQAFIKVLLTKMRSHVRLGRWLKQLVEPLENPPFETHILQNQQLPNAREQEQTIFEYVESHVRHGYARRARRNFEQLAKEVIAYDQFNKTSAGDVAAHP